MDHLSSSQITLYLLCGLKYRFQYVDEVPAPFRSSALVFGSALHSALAWYHGERMKGKGVALETLYRVFDADWYSQKASTEIRFRDGEQEMTLVSLGKEMLTLYTREAQPAVKGCEVPFTVPITDRETGEALDVDLKGFFDLIQTDGTIVEYKTSAQALSALDIETRVQFTAYSYAFEMLYQRPPEALKVVNFVKAKKPRITETVVKRNRNDYRGFFYLAKAVRAGIEMGTFIPHPGYWCRDCEYHDICPLWQRK